MKKSTADGTKIIIQMAQRLRKVISRQCIGQTPVLLASDQIQKRNHIEKTLSSTVLPKNDTHNSVEDSSQRIQNETHSKRSRGRPPKEDPIIIPPNYNKPGYGEAMRRLKNAEASRRSRRKSRNKEMALYDEVAKLMQKNENLKRTEAHLDLQLKRWHNKFVKLALI